MTTERTPQDVLRATPREKAIAALAELARWYPDSGLANGLVDDIQAALMDDKAIAEAPDGPPCDYCGHADEQHGDADPECTIKDCHCPAYRSGTRLRRAAPDTLSEKPGLDVERLARAVHNVEGGTFKTATCYHDPTTGEPVDCKWTAELLAAEYASTDNEGR